MCADPEISYRVGKADQIEAVSDGWIAFARENWGEDLLPPTVLGRLLWGSISDPITRGIYETLMARVRRGQGPVHFRFRCDSPGMRRLLDMRMSLAEDGVVVFTTTPVALESRDAVPLLERGTRRTGSILVSCAWCARVRVTEHEWLEVEAAVGILDPFKQNAGPRLSHGMCPDCFAAMTREAAGEAPVDGSVTTLGALALV